MKPKAEQRCENCYFVLSEDHESVPMHEASLTCRRRAPSIITPNHLTQELGPTQAIWPEVHQTDWCGEWKDAEPTPITATIPSQEQIETIIHNASKEELSDALKRIGITRIDVT